MKRFTQEEFDNKDNADIWICITLAISLGIGANLDEVNAFEVETPDKIITFRIEKEEWKEFLDIAIDWFIKKEEYELCSEISRIKNCLK